MKFKKTVLTLLIGSVCTMSHAAPLQEELQHLLKTHPLLKASKKQVLSADERILAAKAAFYPKLTLSATYGNEEIDSTSFLPDANFALGKAGRGATQTSNLSAKKYGATFTMPIYQGLRLRAQLQTQTLDKDLASLDEASLEQALLLEGITAYMQVARYKMLIELTKVNEQSTQEQLELEAKRVAGGGGVQVDELQARTRLQIVRERRVFYQQGLRDVLATYEQVFGKAPNLDAFQSVDVSNAALPASIQDAITTAMNFNPELQSIGLDIQKSEQSVIIEHSNQLAKVNLVARKTKDTESNALAEREDHYVGLEMSWTFSMGNEFGHREAAAKLEKEALIDRSVNIKNKNTEQVRIAYNQVINGQERLELLENAADISENVMMDRKQLRDAGKETALSALDAEVEYYGVLANKINAQIDTKIGAYRLMAAMGKLSADDLGVMSELTIPVKPLRVALDRL